MSGRLAGKVALITGGASGMGRAAAIAFAREGADVTVADLDEAGAEAVASAIADGGGRVRAAWVDVTDARAVERVVTAVADRAGALDVLYHTAADLRFINYQDRRLTELPDDVWRRMIDVHLTGTFLVCKHAGRQMLARRSGSIILSGTTDALIGCAGLDSYTAAKGGVVSLTRSFAAGVGKDGIRVNCICPGFVSTEGQMDWLETPAGREAMERLHLLPIATPEQIAAFAVYLASDESAPVTGGIFPIDSGYMAFKAHLDVMGAIKAGEANAPA